jgi:hypothetical protein
MFIPPSTCSKLSKRRSENGPKKYVLFGGPRVGNLPTVGCVEEADLDAAHTPKTRFISPVKFVDAQVQSMFWRAPWLAVARA